MMETIMAALITGGNGPCRGYHHQRGKQPQGRKQYQNVAGGDGCADQRADTGSESAQQFRPKNAGSGRADQSYQPQAGRLGTRKSRGVIPGFFYTPEVSTAF